MEIILAVTACERLILLNTDAKELRDYSILLYLCGFYEEALEFLKKYQDLKVSFLSLCEITIDFRSLTEQEVHLSIAEFFHAKPIGRFNK